MGEARKTILEKGDKVVLLSTIKSPRLKSGLPYTVKSAHIDMHCGDAFQLEEVDGIFDSEFFESVVNLRNNKIKKIKKNVKEKGSFISEY